MAVEKKAERAGKENNSEEEMMIRQEEFTPLFLKQLNINLARSCRNSSSTWKSSLNLEGKAFCPNRG